MNETVERLLSERGGAVPRYTSYPTAPHFGPLTDDALPNALFDAARAAADGVSVYIHIPYCDRLCWFCGCNTKHTLKYEPVAEYVESVVADIAQLGTRIGTKPHAAHVHFGGGSPSILKSEDMSALHEALSSAFSLDSLTEISVEIDPSDVTEDTLVGLTALGVTRISIGVQDFDPLVQQAINRPQSFKQTRDVIEAVRGAGVGSVNIDALYGLPLQTSTRLQRTLEQVVSLEPDRIALFGYAHVPWIKKHQKMIKDEHLPGTIERFEQAQTAAEGLVAGGYQRIGIDHFAKPGDGLAYAARTNRLRRNFQGYTADNCEVLVPIGGSSIGQYAGGYIQNEVATARYRQRVDEGALAAVRGYVMTRDDVIRAHIIERIMCDFAVSANDIVARFALDATAYIEEMSAVAAADRDGLCEMVDGVFLITEFGRPFTRVIASRFDAHLAGSSVRYSKAV
ncbi:MAG: oxygen-independent coproporphyrinogen III oxidase [Pseudomonadota bacterium]